MMYMILGALLFLVTAIFLKMVLESILKHVYVESLSWILAVIILLLSGIIITKDTEYEEHVAELENQIVELESQLAEKEISETNMTFRLDELNVIEYQNVDYTFDIMTPSYLSEEDIYKMLSEYPTPIANNQLIQYSKTFYETEQKYGVNVLYLIATLALESGWGNHTSGINNIGGWTKNDGSFMDFESVNDCIDHIGNRLSTSYVDMVGSNIGEVMKRYCQTPGYGDTVLGIMDNLQGVLI